MRPRVRRLIALSLGALPSAHASSLYGLCKGQHVEFYFVGEGDSAANVAIRAAKLSIAGRDTLTLDDTDGFYANSALSFKLGSVVYNGSLVMNDDLSLEITEPGLTEKAECRTNLFDGQIVEASAERVFSGPPDVEQVIEDVQYSAERQCPGDPIHYPNIAVIGPELLNEYQTVVTQLPYAQSRVKVSALFRCLLDGDK
jgi:hypothetical protein